MGCAGIQARFVKGGDIFTQVNRDCRQVLSMKIIRSEINMQTGFSIFSAVLR